MDSRCWGRWWSTRCSCSPARPQITEGGSYRQRTTDNGQRTRLTDRVLITMDDPEGVLRKSEPDVVVLTGALQESTAIELLGVARDNSVSTLGLVEASTGDPRGLAHRLGLTAWVGKPVGR